MKNATVSRIKDEVKETVFEIYFSELNNKDFSAIVAKSYDVLGNGLVAIEGKYKGSGRAVKVKIPLTSIICIEELEVVDETSAEESV